MEPQAVAIPKHSDDWEMGRYGPVWPKTPACYGFTIIAEVKPGRAETIREHSKRIEAAVAANPDVLAPLKLHYLRWVLFDNDTSIPTSTSTLRMPSRSSSRRAST